MTEKKNLLSKITVKIYVKLSKQQTDILENHRVSRSIVVNSEKNADEDESPLDISKSSLNDTLTERDMNDILGPLPEIPIANGECCNRLSTRRSSGCSGIYEEILDPADGNL